jgi:periplasmic divalent cation tolerance protein
MAKISDSGKYVVVLITCPQHATQKITSAIMTKRLAACVNSVPNISSTFWWEGKLTSDMESLLLVKTKRGLFSKLEQEVKRVHPYKTPEIICLPITSGNRGYLGWIAKETRARRRR